MAPGDASSPAVAEMGITVGDFTGNVPGLILRGKFNSFSYPPPGPAASAGSHLNPGTVSLPSLARAHPSGLFFAGLNFTKFCMSYLKHMPEAGRGGEGRIKDQTQCVAELYVCIY